MKKVIIFVLVVIIIIGAGIFVARKIVKDDETKLTSQTRVNETKDNNVTGNNVNVITNTMPENEIKNNNNNEINTNETKPNENEEVEPQTDEERAIAIVKKEWGADNSVNFTFDHKTENGEYVIAVRNSNTTAAIEWYIVDLSTGTCRTR